MPDDPKVVVDDDWKAEAQREKERLAKEADKQGPDSLPEASFVGVLNLLAMQAMVSLGGMAGPGEQQIPPSPELAKHYIDLIAVLEDKTRGNLNDAEKRALDTTLYNLRMAYVEVVGGGMSDVAPGTRPA